MLFRSILSKCIHLTEVFDHKNHVCLVFELLGSSVFDFLKENNFVPFPMAHIQDFARQLLTSVACMSFSFDTAESCSWSLTLLSLNPDMHRLGLVHTDLKPENILLADSSYRTIPSRVRFPKTALSALITPLTLSSLLSYRRKLARRDCSSTTRTSG